MCELLGMSALHATTIRLSFEELARHGGGTGPHRDGWGVGFLQEGDAWVFREPDAANESPWVPFLQSHSPTAPIALAHIRKATQGVRTLRNTQPFARELGGRVHVFAHNGMLPGIEDDHRFASRRFRRIGDTDSEQAFCALMDRLAPLWDHAVPDPSARIAVLRQFAGELASLGLANFLYTDGDLVVGHAHRRRHNDGMIRAPGLHVLCRTCAHASEAPPLAGLGIDPSERQEVAILASVPLSGEAWRPLDEGEIVVLRAGQVMPFSG